MQAQHFSIDGFSRNVNHEGDITSKFSSFSSHSMGPGETIHTCSTDSMTCCSPLQSCSSSIVHMERDDEESSSSDDTEQIKFTPSKNDTNETRPSLQGHRKRSLKRFVDTLTASFKGTRPSMKDRRQKSCGPILQTGSRARTMSTETAVTGCSEEAPEVMESSDSHEQPERPSLVEFRKPSLRDCMESYNSPRRLLRPSLQEKKEIERRLKLLGNQMDVGTRSSSTGRARPSLRDHRQMSCGARMIQSSILDVSSGTSQRQIVARSRSFKRPSLQNHKQKSCDAIHSLPTIKDNSSELSIRKSSASFGEEGSSHLTAQKVSENIEVSASSQGQKLEIPLEEVPVEVESMAALSTNNSGSEEKEVTKDISSSCQIQSEYIPEKGNLITLREYEDERESTVTPEKSSKRGRKQRMESNRRPSFKRYIGFIVVPKGSRPSLKGFRQASCGAILQGNVKTDEIAFSVDAPGVRPSLEGMRRPSLKKVRSWYKEDGTETRPSLTSGKKLQCRLVAVDSSDTDDESLCVHEPERPSLKKSKPPSLKDCMDAYHSPRRRARPSLAEKKNISERSLKKLERNLEIQAEKEKRSDKAESVRPRPTLGGHRQMSCGALRLQSSSTTFKTSSKVDKPNNRNPVARRKSFQHRPFLVTQKQEKLDPTLRAGCMESQDVGKIPEFERPSLAHLKQMSCGALEPNKRRSKRMQRINTDELTIASDHGRRRPTRSYAA